MAERLKHYGNSIPVRATPIISGPLLPVAARLLEKEGCTITLIAGGTQTAIEYPPGTTRQELYPRTTDIRYRVMLPGGRELREVDRRGRAEYGSLISLQIVVTPEELERLEREARQKIQHGKKDLQDNV